MIHDGYEVLFFCLWPCDEIFFLVVNFIKKGNGSLVSGCGVGGLQAK
jgi:hypothetical protein